MKNKFDLKKLRERKDIAPNEKRDISARVKEEKRILVCNEVERSFDIISNSSMKCNPTKYEKIKSNLEEIKEKERKEKEYKERRKNTIISP